MIVCLEFIGATSPPSVSDVIAQLVLPMGLLGWWVWVAVTDPRKREARREYEAYKGLKRKIDSGSASDEDWVAWQEAGEGVILAVNRRSDKKWEQKGASDLPAIRDRVQQELATYSATRVAGRYESSKNPTLTELATLRSEGMISGEEFEAFAERFTVSTGARAREVIAAIRELYDQHSQGAMTVGNYRASLWTLMDRLESATKTRR